MIGYALEIPLEESFFAVQQVLMIFDAGKHSLSSDQTNAHHYLVLVIHSSIDQDTRRKLQRNH